MLFIPPNVEFVIETLQKNGYEAYVVGGCVRDMLTGKTPHDFDVTTDATPEEVIKLFEKTVPTGIKHGTVTVLIGGTPVETTTYRTEGNYKDHRRPESVSFVKSLREDLSRRDFTVNAMAYNSKDGLKDYFSGREDIEKSILRAVGDPEKRFNEDALRILRLFRFSSVLKFKPDGATLAAALKFADLLKAISAERIFSELLKALCGENPAALKPLTDIGGLDFLGLTAAPDYEKIKALKTPDEKLFAFFYSGRADVGAALERLKASSKTKKAAKNMLTLLALPFPSTKSEIKEMLFLTSPSSAEEYFDFKAVYGEDTQNARLLLREITDKNEPYKISDLKITGGDLVSLGISGEAVGKTLEALRRLAVSDPALNTKKKLLEKAQSIAFT
ncbi:MAG: CCA tRNA nucleotidyltransferase [Acutalibacteraceae bacterium]|nr:CCA tRNA nucleotidyltransferase [Acutalibacteraceae bacterium]